MAITAKDIANIFPGMDLGVENIAKNFNKLLEENIGQDNQLDTLNNKTLKIGNFIGNDNPNIDNLEPGIYPFGFWQDKPISTNETSWPKRIRGGAEWGWIVQYGGKNQTKAQFIFGAGTVLCYRAWAGNRWDNWALLNLTVEQ